MVEMDLVGLLRWEQVTSWPVPLSRMLMMCVGVGVGSPEEEVM